MSFELPKLPYKYNSLEPYIDEQTMRIHHGKHHQAYTDKLNAALVPYPGLQGKKIEDLLSSLDAVPEQARTAVRNNGGGYYNHNFFWEIMGPGAGGRPGQDSRIGKAIARDFGSFEAFKEKFSNAALNQFGSGWAWLVLSGGKLEIVSTPNQDTPISQGKAPLLCIDVWEHSYYLKWQSNKAGYIASWWNVINWIKVNELYGKATSKT